MRIKGKRNRHLVVQIPGVLIAAIELTPDMIELITKKEQRITQIPRIDSSDKFLRPSDSKRPAVERSNRERPSKNVDKDKKLLLDTAHRLLFDIPEKYQHENEYYLLLTELKRTRERLKTFKGYTPSSEAELALPLYLAAVILNDNIAPAESRLQTAIVKLKDTSKLKKLCQEYLEKLKAT
jgi:hypothetical protein